MNRAVTVILLVLLVASLLISSMATTLTAAAEAEGTYRDRLRFIPDTETGRTPGETNTSKPIKILNAKSFQTDAIPAERVYLGQMYKACVIRLPDDTLRLSARATAPRYDFSRNEFPILKSADGGRAWSKLPEPPFKPSENYMSTLGDGTVLMTFASAWRDKSQGDFSSTIYRSEDGCRDWKPCGPSGSVVGSRNVLQLTDGSLLWGQAKISSRAKEKDTLWRSTDAGRTWAERYRARFQGMPEDYPYGMFLEMFLWQSTSGQLFGIARVDFRHMPPIPGKKAPSREWINMVIDGSEGMLLYTSDDMGRNWKPVRYLGDYGQHYPSILKLQDGRLLLSYTVRDPVPHETGLVGTSAVLGSDQGDDLQFDFDHDVIEIEARLPYCRQPYGRWQPREKGGPWIWNPRGAAGWSPTVQLKDGTLVTAYSYRTGTSNDNAQKGAHPVHSEAVRWRLPKMK